jgi:hypothetical protein
MENVNVKNPKTGQVLTVPRKLYDSVYRDKGFDLIDRGSAEAAGSTGKPAKAAAGSKPPADKTGSAADIAKNLGIEGETGTEGMTFPEAAEVAKEQKANEIDVNPGNAASEERNSAQRDRGRTK